MTPSTQILLETFWSWTGGVLAVLLLGIIAPVALALLLGALPLMRERHDHRAAIPFGVITVVFFAAGAAVLLVSPHRGPAVDFWLALSLQIALIAFVVSIGNFLHLSIRRARAERTELATLAEVPTRVPNGTALNEPGPRPRLNAIDAEYYVAEWIRALGAVEARVTPARRDGGVDVRSRYYVAQVKHRPQDYVSVDVVRALHGVASSEHREGLVFSSGRYTTDALAFARDAGVALFIFRPQDGRLVAANAQAERLRRDGLRSEARPGAIASQPSAAPQKV